MTKRIDFGGVRDSLRTQLWPVPLVATVIAVVLGQYLPYLDHQLDEHLSDFVSGFLFGGGPKAAQSVLQTIAGSLVTVTALTFSLTVVTLQLASSQFSPRLLRTFSRDKFVHNTLALFLATFVFSLTVLRSIRAETSDGDGFVPRLSVTVGFGLTVASVVALVFFLAHLATQIRVETMLRDVHSESNETIARIFPDEAEKTPVDANTPEGEPTVICSAVSGFLLSVDAEAAAEAASETDTFVVIDAAPGSSLVEGVPFARAWSTDGRPLDDERLATLSRQLNDHISTGFERTSTQDAGYGLQQLLDVATRALSPAVNDPTTAVHALGHISAVLCNLTTRHTGPKLHADHEGRPRVLLRYPTFEDLLEQVTSQMLRYALDDARTAGRVVRMLREISWVAGTHPHSTDIRRQVATLRSALDCADLLEHEKRQLQAECDAAEGAGSGLWPAP